MAEGVRETITIPADPDEVWELLMDPRCLGEWVSVHRKLGDEMPDLPLDAGDRFKQKLGVGPVGFWVEWCVAEARAPELARWTGEGPGGSTAKVTYRLSRNGDGGTRFEYENDFDPPGGLMGKAAKRAVNAAAGHREAQRSMKRLRAVFEER
jgi:uncharacterized protein YndB with AHSA1/START domain